jgi:hypothetical protein
MLLPGNMLIQPSMPGQFLPCPHPSSWLYFAAEITTALSRAVSITLCRQQSTRVKQWAANNRIGAGIASG